MVARTIPGKDGKAVLPVPLGEEGGEGPGAPCVTATTRHIARLGPHSRQRQRPAVGAQPVAQTATRKPQQLKMAQQQQG